MRILSTNIASAALAAVVGFSAAATAQNADNAFQQVALLNAELNFLHEANLTTAPADTQGQAVLVDRLPRHVLQKAREVFFQAQALREINGYGLNDFPALPLGEATGTEVAAALDGLLSQLGDLRDAYGVTAQADATVPQGKSWSDVYHELNIAGASLVALGVPAANANTVFRVAATVVSDLEQIRAHQGITAPIEVAAADTKNPTQVCEHGLALLADLRALVDRNGAIVVPGSIAGLTPLTHDAHGSDVLDVLNNVLAEVAAIKAALGISSQTAFAPSQTGRSPALVFDQVSTAMAMVATL